MVERGWDWKILRRDFKLPGETIKSLKTDRFMNYSTTLLVLNTLQIQPDELITYTYDPNYVYFS